MIWLTSFSSVSYSAESNIRTPLMELNVPARPPLLSLPLPRVLLQEQWRLSPEYLAPESL